MDHRTWFPRCLEWNQSSRHASRALYQPSSFTDPQGSFVTVQVTRTVPGPIHCVILPHPSFLCSLPLPPACDGSQLSCLLVPCGGSQEGMKQERARGHIHSLIPSGDTPRGDSVSGLCLASYVGTTKLLSPVGDQLLPLVLFGTASLFSRLGVAASTGFFHRCPCHLEFLHPTGNQTSECLH